MDSKTRFQNLVIRSLVIQAIRDFFSDRDYLEVETPVLSSSIIPEAQIDPVAADGGFLQASPELCMKRLLSAGFDKIFQICKCFRKDERGERHLPELTMLEWYARDDTYLDLMDQCEDLIRFIAEKLGMGNRIIYQDKPIRLNQAWPRLTLKKAFEDFTGTSLSQSIEEGRFDEILSFQVEPFLGSTSPVFLCDYPKSLASLAKLLPHNAEYAQRFELYIAGMELANGFTELTDPSEQLDRFKKENQIRISQNKDALPVPEKFIADLRSMPDAAGIALGVDRLVMLFCNAVSIDDVVAFTPETL